MIRIVSILIALSVIFLAGYLSPVDGTANEGVDEGPAPYVQVNITEDVIVLPQTVTVLEFNAINYATAATFDWEYPTRLRAPRSCVYLIVGQVSFDNVYAGGENYLYVVRNGGGVESILAIVESEWRDMEVVATAILNQSDYVELVVFVDGEASKRVEGINTSNPSFSITCLTELAFGGE